MAIRSHLFCFLITLFTGALQAQSATIQSPDEFLEYKLGSRFTPHHLLVDYFKYVDGISDNM
ncbi:MAG TPA: hypothetical protein PLV75_10180, partial [Saprospiraceae bacterium]|nr:hypothetical protein [Saprospiraceae bacterium]